MSEVTSKGIRSRRGAVKVRLRRQWDLYLLVALPVLWYIIFCYGPMYGLLMAFQNYQMNGGFLGIIKGPWIGFDHFVRFFTSRNVGSILSNTLVISLYSLLVNTPVPIILALSLSEAHNKIFKKSVQMATYAPHFLSTTVVVGMMSAFLSQSTGIINGVIVAMGGRAVDFLGSNSMFKHLYVLSGTWQNMGWSSIIYMAAIAGVSPELHEAAMIDGASRFGRIRHVTLPGILPTIVILMILNSGSLMNVGFDKIYLMQTPLNTRASEVISTYTYKMGIREYQYSYAAAVGLFNSVVAFVMLVLVNTISKRVSEYSLW